jgi:hypothetical protein
MAQQPGGELPSTDPTTRTQDAAFQESGLSPKISLNSRSHLQYNTLYGIVSIKPFFISIHSSVISQSAAVETIRGELAIGHVSTRRNLVCGGPCKDPNHDAAMRIGSEAPR